MDETKACQMTGNPLRKIPPEAISWYAASAMTTIGNEEDYAYFLPRILELSILENLKFPDLEITGKRIHMSGYSHWPEKRRLALTQVFVAVTSSTLANGKFFELDSWITAIALTGQDIQPYLAMLEQHPNAVLNYFEGNAATLPEGRLRNAFWPASHPGQDAIVAWFRSPAIRKILFDAYGYVI
ncbi:MAG: hypothetical protein C0478_18580 [Planctomyces sp.]|nr:hypothetical protein [Planctomyces sp.]